MASNIESRLMDRRHQNLRICAIDPFGVLVFVMVLFCGLGCQTANLKLINGVIVQRLDMNLPADQTDAQQVLSDAFMNKPEEMIFASLKTKDWRPRFHDYERMLLRKAECQGLDSDSLRACLKTVFEHAGEQMAYLPVGVYFAKQNASPVWIVVVKWENDVPPELLRLEKAGLPRKVQRKIKEPALSHWRVFVFDRHTRELKAWSTCG
jgi:hypothetical protein